MRICPLRHLLSHQRRDGVGMNCYILEHSPVSLLPHSPHGVDDRPARLPSLVLREACYCRVPPSIEGAAIWWRRGTNLSVPSKDALAHGGREAAVEREVLHRLRMYPAKLANRVVWPPTDCQVVSCENLAMERHPCKEPTLSLCMPSKCFAVMLSPRSCQAKMRGVPLDDSHCN